MKQYLFAIIGFLFVIGLCNVSCGMEYSLTPTEVNSHSLIKGVAPGTESESELKKQALFFHMYCHTQGCNFENPKFGCLDEIQRMLTENPSINLEYKDASGYTALHWAVSTGRFVLAGILLQNGAAVNTKTSTEDIHTNGFTALHLAAESNSANAHLGVLLLLQHKADIKSKNSNGKTPLHCAAKHNNLQIVQTLLSWDNCDVNAQDAFGNTPLINAVHNQQDTEIVKLLLEYGADPCIKNISGMSALDVASLFNEKIMVSLLQQYTGNVKVMTNRRTMPLLGMFLAVSPNKGDGFFVPSHKEGAPGSFFPANHDLASDAHNIPTHTIKKPYSCAKITLGIASLLAAIYYGYAWYTTKADTTHDTDTFSLLTAMLTTGQYGRAYVFARDNQARITNLSADKKSHLQTIIIEQENTLANAAADNATSLIPFRSYFSRRTSLDLHYLATLWNILNI